MDGDFVIDLDEVMDSLENGEVISLSFQTFNKALVIDTRSNRAGGAAGMRVPGRGVSKGADQGPAQDEACLYPPKQSHGHTVAQVSGQPCEPGRMGEADIPLRAGGAPRGSEELRDRACRAPVPREGRGRRRPYGGELSHDLVGYPVREEVGFENPPLQGWTRLPTTLGNYLICRTPCPSTGPGRTVFRGQELTGGVLR